MMKMNKHVKTAIFVAIICLAIGLLLGSGIKYPWYQEALRQQEVLRDSLEIEKKNVIKLRCGITHEIELANERIRRSEAKADSVIQLHVQNERRLQQEINRLKKLTVKELQNEAERIYREHGDNHQ